MKCPRCVQRIHRSAATCPHCGFSLADADLLFGTCGPRVRCLADAAGLLRQVERVEVEHELRRFRELFPQLFLAVHTAVLPVPASLRQFGFWLLNRALFEDAGEGRPNAAGLLLVIDAESKCAGLTFGYLLDPFLGEADTFRCLARAHPFLLEGDYRRGIGVVWLGLVRLLRRRCRQARRNPRRFGPAAGAVPRGGGLVRRVWFGGGGCQAGASGAEA